MCDLYTMCDLLYAGKNLLVTERTFKQRTAEQQLTKGSDWILNEDRPEREHVPARVMLNLQ